MEGKVYLVGAGPGDAELITLKGLHCIQEADVILYDRLISKQLLSYGKPSAEKIYVGKKSNQHTMVQEEIQALLIEKAKENKVVVRLKGGDPFVFGRGGEEALALKEENIPFEIVPGISSSIAAPAYAGIPVTHRGVSTSFHVITGHEDPTKEQEEVDYETLAKLKGTLVFLMGLSNIHRICTELMRHGKAADTPIAVVSKGTSLEQKVAVGALDTIEQNLEDIVSPAMIVIGEVVKLREELSWLEKKPLFGRRILVTRARHQASALVEKIHGAGGSTVEFPTIAVVPKDNEEQLIKMYESLGIYKWILFTSVNGVEVFFDKLKEFQQDIRKMGQAKICAIGQATKEALEKRYLKVDFTPEEYVAEALIEGLKERMQKGDKVLIPRAEVAREVLPNALRELGAQVKVVPLYETVVPTYEREGLIKVLKNIDTITFTSSSTVNNFVEILGKAHLDLLDAIQVACIGPITAETARKHGIEVHKIPKKYTIEGLVNVLHKTD